jgi:competence protein ComFC
MLYNLIFPGQCACCGTSLSIYKQSIGCNRCYRLLLEESFDFKNNFSQINSQFREYNFFFLNLGLHKHLLKRAKLKPSIRALKMLFEVSVFNSDFDYQRINNVDLVIPIPSHFTSLVKRGFSPSAEFGKLIANLIEKKFSSIVLKQIYGVQKQAKLKKIERILNVKNSFFTSPELIKDKSVLLVDDIITTGATINESRLALIKGGAKNVEILAMAVSPLLFHSRY